MKLLPGETPGVRNDLLRTMKKHDLAAVIGFHSTGALVVGDCNPDTIIQALRLAADQLEEQIKIKQGS